MLIATPNPAALMPRYPRRPAKVRMRASGSSPPSILTACSPRPKEGGRSIVWASTPACASTTVEHSPGVCGPAGPRRSWSHQASAGSMPAPSASPVTSVASRGRCWATQSA